MSKVYMLKDEIVQLHMALYYVKRLFESAGIANEHFKRYNELGVLPTHVHKDKADHEIAVKILCKGLLEVLKRF